MNKKPVFKVRVNGRVYVDRSMVTAELDNALDVGDATHEEMYSRMEGRISELIADLDSENPAHYLSE